jgi:large subunit ribosomal protein L25
MSYSISAKPRPKDLTAQALRAEKRVPAVLYGFGVENALLELDEQAFKKIYLQAGENQLVDLLVEGKDAVQVIIREVQTHHVKDRITHVDFYAVDVNSPVEVDIPLHFEGVAPAVKSSGGSLLKRHEYLPVRTLPKDLVKYIVVPVDSLETIEDVVKIKDLQTKDSWEILVDVEDVVAQILPPRVIEEPTVSTPAEGEVGTPVEGEATASAEADKKEASDKAGADKPKSEAKK